MNNKKYENANTTYFNKKKNHWVAQYSITIDGERYRPTATGATEEEALSKLEARKRKFFKNKNNEKKVSRSKETVASVVDSLLSLLDNSVEHATFQEYCYRGRLLKESNIGKREIGKLDRSIIQAAVNEVANKHKLSESVCKKLIQFTKRIFTYAKEEKIISENPIAKNNSLRLPLVATNAKDVKPLSSNDKDLILNILETSPRFKPIVYTMLYAGLRLGEALALTWDKVNFEKGEIWINCAVKKHKGNSDSGAKTIFKIGKTKTKGSVRTVYMSEELRKCLLEWKNIQPFVAKDVTGIDLCFPKPNGKLCSGDAYQEAFSTFLQKLGVDHTVYHSRVFRHTYASYLVDVNVNPNTLKEILGHSNIETTLKYYVNTNVSALQEVARLTDQVMKIEGDFKFENVI